MDSSVLSKKGVCENTDLNQNDPDAVDRNLIRRSEKTNLQLIYSKTMLSPFQTEKLEFYFRFFDTRGNNFLEYDLMEEFIQKILDFTKWDTNSSEAQELREVHQTFAEVLKEKVGQAYDDKVTLAEWLSLWEQILPGCMGMHNCPVWLRLLPRSLFRIIDRKEDGIVDEEELCDFYTDMVKLEPKEAKVVAKKGYEEMTDFGRYPLTLEGYEQIFANFLFGRTPYGPGRYIFGCFEHDFETEKFKLIQAAPEVEAANRARESSRSGMRTSATRRPSATVAN